MGPILEAWRRAQLAKAHDIKVWPDYFEAIRTHRKPWEVRENDRGYREGDTLILREWDPKSRSYTGRALKARVGYVCSLPMGGKWVGMTLKGVRSW